MKMRAKFLIVAVTPASPENGGIEKLEMCAVGGDAVQHGYPETGDDEDNNYAHWSPSAALSISIANPALHGQYQAGQKFYVDFTPAAEPASGQ